MLLILFMRFFYKITFIIVLALEPETAQASAVLNHENRLANKGCRIFLPSNQILVPSVADEMTQELLLPIQDNENLNEFYIHILNNQTVRVDCDTTNILNVDENSHYMHLTCVQGPEFLRTNEYEKILLTSPVECHIYHRTSVISKNGHCFEGCTNFDVDIVIGTSQKYFSSCVDERTSETLYSTSYLDGDSLASGLGEDLDRRPAFYGNKFYDTFRIDEAYMWKNAQGHLIKLLGSKNIVDRYFPSQHYHFSRGHLFPCADAVKRYEKQATFYYQNAAPQWQLLNTGNWASVEREVRNYSKITKRKLNVITGAFGVTTLPDENNNHIDIWLAHDSGDMTNTRLPVPRFLWKVVHDPVAGTAIAYVQVNNPWILRGDLDILCVQNLCERESWLVKKSGYTYCCDVDELRRSIPYIPLVQYTGILVEPFLENNKHNVDYEDESKT